MACGVCCRSMAASSAWVLRRTRAAAPPAGSTRPLDMLTPDEYARAEAEARLHAHAAEDLRVKHQIRGCGCLLTCVAIGACIAFPPLLVVAIPAAFIVWGIRALTR